MCDFEFADYAEDFKEVIVWWIIYSNNFLKIISKVYVMNMSIGILNKIAFTKLNLKNKVDWLID